MSYDIVDVEPDTTAWELERLNSVGASDVPAIMGMSPYSTALDVYKAKHGAENTFDPILAYTGHASEPIMEGWLNQFSGLDLEVSPGFMARSTEWPFLHASFDRVQHDPFIPIQMKTAHQRTEHKFDEGVPDDIRVQVQAELAVAGAPKALIVVWIGGREFRSYWEPRDDRFIQEHMIPTVREFWQGVQDGVPPAPSTVGEIAEVYPSTQKEVELSESAYEVLERITVLNSDIKAQETERDQLKLALAGYVEDADTLMYEGRKVATWKSQQGRASFDRRAFEADHPRLYADYVKQGAPFKVLRAVKSKETKNV